MAVVALRVTFHTVDSALTAPGGVALAPGPPARPPSHPADLRLAHGTTQPVTAPFLHQHHLAGGTGEGVALFHHFIEHFFRPFRVLVDLGFLLHALLVLLAIQTNMDGLEKYGCYIHMFNFLFVNGN